MKKKEFIATAKCLKQPVLFIYGGENPERCERYVELWLLDDQDKNSKNLLTVIKENRRDLSFNNRTHKEFSKYNRWLDEALTQGQIK